MGKLDARRDACVCTFSSFKHAMNLTPECSRVARNDPLVTDEWLDRALEYGTRMEPLAVRLVEHFYTRHCVGPLLQAPFTYLRPDSSEAFDTRFGGTGDRLGLFAASGPLCVEIKCPFMRSQATVGAWNDQVPLEYLPQLEGQMRGYGLRECLFVVLVLASPASVTPYDVQRWLNCETPWVEDAHLHVWQYRADDVLWHEFMWPRTTARAARLLGVAGPSQEDCSLSDAEDSEESIGALRDVAERTARYCFEAGSPSGGSSSSGTAAPRGTAADRAE